MKKLIAVISLCMCTMFTFAQNEKFVKAMAPKVAAMDTTRNTNNLKELANGFERIAIAEKTEWLPYYYAALATVNMGYTMMDSPMSGDASKIDPVTDKAEALLMQAEALSKNNSEIYVVKKMINSLRMIVDPQNRYMVYGPVAQEALETAKQLNPENPRVYLLEGQDKFFTPEQFGGSKTEAKKLFETASQKYAAFKPASNLDPAWGKGTLQYFMAQVNK